MMFLPTISNLLNMKIVIGFCLVILLSSCSSPPVKTKPSTDGAPRNTKVDVTKIPNAVPKKEPKSRYGNPKSYVVFGKRYYVMDSSVGFKQRGDASWYGTKFHGRRTSSGETYDMYAMTAAHKSLPLPTYVRVRNLKNGKSIVVKVNDRGPFHEGRIIDLSYVAALKLDVVRTGTAPVEIEAILPGQNSEPRQRYAETENKPKEVMTVNNRSNGFYVQAGSFSSLENAKSLRKQLSKTSAHLVSIQQTRIDEKIWYRVLIGPVADASLANIIVSKLEKHGIYNPNFISQ